MLSALTSGMARASGIEALVPAPSGLARERSPVDDSLRLRLRLAGWLRRGGGLLDRWAGTLGDGRVARTAG